MEISLDLIAKFVTRTATDEEKHAVLDACRTDLKTANKVIIGFSALQTFEEAGSNNLHQRIAKKFIIEEILEKALKPE